MYYYAVIFLDIYWMVCFMRESRNLKALIYHFSTFDTKSKWNHLVKTIFCGRTTLIRQILA